MRTFTVETKLIAGIAICLLLTLWGKGGGDRNRVCLSSDMWNLARYLEISKFLCRYYTISRGAPVGGRCCRSTAES